MIVKTGCGADGALHSTTGHLCCQVKPDPVTMVPTEQLEDVARDWVRAVTGLQVDTVPQFIQLLQAEDDTGFKLAR